jgi:hypothetical protein
MDSKYSGCNSWSFVIVTLLLTDSKQNDKFEYEKEQEDV